MHGSSSFRVFGNLHESLAIASELEFVQPCGDKMKDRARIRNRDYVATI